MSEAQIDRLNIEITADAEQAVTGLNKLTNALKKLDKASNTQSVEKLKGLLDGIAKLDFTSLDKLSQSGEGVNKFANAMNKLNKLSQNADLTQLSAEMQKISVIDFSNLNGFVGLATAVTQVQSLTAQLTNATTAAQSLNQQLNQTQQEKGKTTPSNQGQSQNSNQPTGDYSGLFSGFTIFGKSLGSIKSKVTSVTSTIVKASGETSTLGKLASGVAGAFSKIMPAVAIASVGLKAMNQIWTFTLKVAKGLLNVVKKIGSALATEVKNKVNGLIEPFKNLISQVKRVVFNRLIREAFNMVQEGITEGLKNVAQGVSSANAVLSKYATQIMYLKNSLGAMLIPLLQQIYPLFGLLTDAVIKATNAINQLFSALAGKSTWTKAKKQYVDYADSVASSSSKANKSLSKLTASFDELNDLTETSTSASEDDLSSYFTTVGIEANIDEFYERLKAGFSNGDLSDVGIIVANKLNSSISNIDSKLTSEWKIKANTWAKALGTFINSSINTIDFGNIGKTLADGLNVIVTSINKFYEEIDFENFGTQLFNLLYGTVMNIEWEEIGTFVLDELVHAFKTLKGFTDKLLEEVDAGNGKTKTNIEIMVDNIFGGLADAINKQLDNGNIAEMGETIGNFIIAIFELGASIFAQSDFWEALTKAVKTVCSKLASKFNDPDFVQSVEDFIVGLGNVACDLIKALNDSGLVNSISNLMTTVFNDPDVKATLSDLFYELGELAGDCFGIYLKAKFFKWYYTIIGKVSAATGFLSNSLTSLASKSVQWATSTVLNVGGYATGGYPTEGQLFIANERGAELVSSFDGKTGVANNDMIVTAIENASYRGYAKAISEYGNGNNNGTQAVQINLDGKRTAEVLAEPVVNAINRRGLKLRTV